MKKTRQYFPDDTYPKIQFTTGDVAWLKHDNGESLSLVFEDGSRCERMKSMMPDYKIVNRPRKSK